MSVDFNTFTTLNTYVVLSNGNISLTQGSAIITTNTYPANYASNSSISGTFTGGTLDDTNKTTALSQLSTLCTNLDTTITTGPSSTLTTIPAGGSITVTPGIYKVNSSSPIFNFTSTQSIVCDGAGTYIFTNISVSGLPGAMNLYGTITLTNGAQLTDIYWYTSLTSGSIRINGTGMKGIFIANGTGTTLDIAYNSVLTTVDGCLYNNVGGTTVYLSSTTFNSETLCYLRNTRIMTNTGYKPIQDISVGDLVLSYGPISESQIVSHSKPLFTPVTWIQSFKPSFKNSSTMPIHFQKDSLGPNIPQNDLWLSPFHGIFVDGKMTQAQEFINGTTITQDFNLEEVEYFHFETEEHCAVDAEGVKSETFINVDYAIRNLPSLNDPMNKMESTKESTMECM